MWGTRNRWTFTETLEAWAAKAPDQVAALYRRRAVDVRRALLQRSTAVGNQLLELGVAPGDRVALFGQNSAQWVDVWLAAVRIGALAVPINLANKGDFLVHAAAGLHADRRLRRRGDGSGCSPWPWPPPLR